MERWDPFRDGFRILERFGTQFSDRWADDDEELDGSGALAPATDVFEDQEGMTIQVELPGVPPSDVVVTLCGDSLVVEADRMPARPHAGGVVQLEGRYGRMRREFPLPRRADPDGAMAELQHGILRLFVPCTMRTSTTTRRIPVGGDDAGSSLDIS